MNPEIILPISLICSTVTYALAARWYAIPRLRNGGAETVVTVILLFHSTRHIGMAFLIPGVTASALDPRFAVPAGYGDLTAAALAFLSLLALRRRWRSAVPLLWIFNVVGTVDLICAVTQGIRFTPNGALGAMYFIPALIVPALLVTHYVLFVALLRRPGLVDLR